MKKLFAIGAFALALAELNAATVHYSFRGMVETNTTVSALDGKMIMGTFSYDDAAVITDGFIKNSDVLSFTVDAFGQSFSKTFDVSYASASTPFYALYFVNGKPDQLSFAVAETQSALDAVTGATATTYPLDNPKAITDSTIQAFKVSVDPAISGTNITLVPEASSALLLGLGSIALLRRRR